MVIMAGNKADMEESRQVSVEDAESYAHAKQIPFFEVSALNGQNVQAMFNEIAKTLTGIETDLIKQTNIT